MVTENEIAAGCATSAARYAFNSILFYEIFNLLSTASWIFCWLVGSLWFGVFSNPIYDVHQHEMASLFLTAGRNRFNKIMKIIGYLGKQKENWTRFRPFVGCGWLKSLYTHVLYI